MSASLRVLSVTFVLGVGGIALSAEPLRYAIQPKQVVPYTVKITAETPTAVETMSGVITYTGKRVEGNNLILEFSGGLSKTTKSTQRRSGRFGGRFGGPFGGRAGGPPIPRGPFDQPDFRGLVTSTSTLVITNTGGVESMRGDSQLPYLLGNLSLLPFETLPAEAVAEWKDGNGLTITTKDSSSSRFGPRFGPFGRNDDEKVKTGGGEMAEYKVQSDDGKLVTIAKTYTLSSPAATKDDTGFEMKGSGTWVFNRTLGASESLDFKMDLKIDSDNSQVTVPIAMTWSRMTDQQYADHLQQVAEKKAELEAKLAEMKAKAAAKAAAEEAAGPTEPKAMNPVFKRTTMFQLKSNVWLAPRDELRKLARSRASGVVKEDMDMLTQVGILRAHSRAEVKAEAEKVWARWKHSFEELASDEQKAAVAAAVGEPVSTKPMKEENPFVVEGEDDGTGLRTWSDKTGRFKVEGTFEKVQGTIVVLKNKDGKLVRIPKARLSEADQELVSRLAKD
ncbi:MAG: SHD1 domain-containing protein [Fuerstiella sp.]